MILSRLCQNQHLLLDITHQQMTRNVIQDTKSKQKQTRTDQTHQHITRRRFQCVTIFTDHNESAGRNRINLYKYVCGKQVIGIDQCQKGTHQQVNQHIVEIFLKRVYLYKQMLSAA